MRAAGGRFQPPVPARAENPTSGLIERFSRIDSDQAKAARAEAQRPQRNTNGPLESQPDNSVLIEGFDLAGFSWIYPDPGQGAWEWMNYKGMADRPL